MDSSQMWTLPWAHPFVSRTIRVDKRGWHMYICFRGVEVGGMHWIKVGFGQGQDEAEKGRTG